MTNTKHTRGRWHINSFTRIEAADFGLIASIRGDLIEQSTHANARLISAAPELLEALEALAALEVKGHSLLDRLQFSGEGRVLSAKICAAIAKARGEAESAA